MKRILGLDLGTNSIGWALVNEAETDEEVSSIIRLGVRVNPLTVDESCFQWLKVTKMKANHNCNRIEPKRREAVSNGPKLLK